MIDLVHPNQPGRELEHVVAKRDDDKLGILGALLNIACNDGDLWLLLADMFNYKIRSLLEILTFLKSRAASISSMTYSGVGL